MEKAVELKESRPYDYSNGGSALSTTFQANNPSWFLLNGLTQGDTASTRDGDEVRSTSVHITGHIFSQDSAYYDKSLVTDYKVRIVIFNFKNPRGTTPTIIGTQAAGNAFCPLFKTSGATTIFPFTMYNTADNCYEHYDVLSDTIVDLKQAGQYWQSVYNAVGQHVQGGFSARFDIKVPVSKIIDYSIGNAGTIADINKNAIFVLFITDWNGTVYGDTLEIDMDAKFFFKDM